MKEQATPSKSSTSTKKNKEVKEWSQETRTGNITKRITVEKLDNTGYLVRINVYGDKPKGGYFDNTSKVFSESNPLEPAENISPLESLFSSLQGK